MLILIFESSVSLVIHFHRPLNNMCSVQADVLSVGILPVHAQVIHSWPAHGERSCTRTKIGRKKKKKTTADNLSQAACQETKM